MIPHSTTVRSYQMSEEFCVGSPGRPKGQQSKAGGSHRDEAIGVRDSKRNASRQTKDQFQEGIMVGL